MGRSFWAEPLARTLGRPDLTDVLAGLEAKGLLRAQPVSSFAGNAEHRFAHALIRDVAYGSLPIARRARAHAEVASWMTAVAGDRSEEVAELIADHYVRAVTGEADLAWFDEPDGTAGRRARRVRRAAVRRVDRPQPVRGAHAPSSSTSRRSRWRPRRRTAPRRWRPPATTTRRRSTATRPCPRIGRRSRCSATIRPPTGTEGGSARRRRSWSSPGAARSVPRRNRPWSTSSCSRGCRAHRTRPTSPGSGPCGAPRRSGGGTRAARSTPSRTGPARSRPRWTRPEPSRCPSSRRSPGSSSARSTWRAARTSGSPSSAARSRSSTGSRRRPSARWGSSRPRSGLATSRASPSVRWTSGCVGTSSPRTSAPTT